MKEIVALILLKPELLVKYNKSRNEKSSPRYQRRADLDQQQDNYDDTTAYSFVGPITQWSWLYKLIIDLVIITTCICNHILSNILFAIKIMVDHND